MRHISDVNGHGHRTYEIHVELPTDIQSKGLPDLERMPSEERMKRFYETKNAI